MSEEKVKTPSHCTGEECAGKAQWIPMFIVRKSKRDPGLRCWLYQLPQCQGHKEVARLKDFLSPEGWDKLSRALREAGKGIYSHRFTSLSWEEITPTKQE